MNRGVAAAPTLVWARAAAGEEAAMRLELDPQASQIAIAIEAAGVLKALAHDRAVIARPRALALVLPGDAGPWDVAVTAAVAAADFAPSGELGDWERREFLENMRGAKVLDAARFPEVAFAGRYSGDLTAGSLTGDLTIRGRARPVRFAVRGERSGGFVTARATWQGRLTDLGIEPYKGMLGTMRLKDKASLEIVAVFRVAPGHPNE